MNYEAFRDAWIDWATRHWIVYLGAAALIGNAIGFLLTRRRGEMK